MSYFVGIGFYLLCKIQNEYFNDALSHNGQEDFITEYKLEDQTKVDLSVALTYFGITTLSTIGLGDYHPKSNFERLICCFIFMLGVTVFSAIFEIICEAIL